MGTTREHIGKKNVPIMAKGGVIKRTISILSMFAQNKTFEEFKKNVQGTIGKYGDFPIQVKGNKVIVFDKEKRKEYILDLKKDIYNKCNKGQN